MSDPRFACPVWNPSTAHIDAVADWGRELLLPTSDPIEALRQPFSVAAVAALCTQPGIWCHDPTITADVLREFDLVLVSDPEYFDPARIVQWCTDLGLKNYRVATSGQWANQSLPDHFIYRPYFVRPFLDRNQSQDHGAKIKPYLFDVLLGARRPHRDYVMLALDQTGLLEQSVVTYRDCFPGAVITEQNTEFQQLFPCVTLKWPYVSDHLDPAWEVADRITNQISMIAPWEIYRRTWYSIVCETLSTGSGFFLSEKTIKAMYSRRVFVVFGPPGSLAWLRSHGFATFDGIIDESYDQEPRDAFRFRKAMAQVMQLAWFERPTDVYDWAQPRLDQNHRRLAEIETARTRDLAQQVKNSVGSHWR